MLRCTGEIASGMIGRKRGRRRRRGQQTRAEQRVQRHVRPCVYRRDYTEEEEEEEESALSFSLSLVKFFVQRRAAIATSSESTGEDLTCRRCLNPKGIPLWRMARIFPGFSITTLGGMSWRSSPWFPRRSSRRYDKKIEPEWNAHPEVGKTDI